MSPFSTDSFWQFAESTVTLATLGLACAFANGWTRTSETTKTLLLRSSVVHALFVLFGAHPLRIAHKTFLSAAIVASFSRPESALAARGKHEIWLQAVAWLIEPAVLSVLGCVYFSAFVIVLDWQQPWQEWPLPCLCGTFLGRIILSVFDLVTGRPKVDNKPPLSTLP